MNHYERRHRENSAAKCLAGAQHALLVEHDLGMAILWSAIAMVHLTALDPRKTQLDRLLGWIEEAKERH